MNKIKFILLVSALTLFSQARAGDGNFSLSVISDGKLILQRVQLLNSEGYDKTITNSSGKFVFSNTVDRFGIYSLGIVCLNPVSKKTSGINIGLFLKPGTTSVVLQGLSGKYVVTGASAIPQKEYEAFTAKDQVYFKKVAELQLKLRQYREARNKKAIAQMEDSLTATLAARKKFHEGYVSEHPNDDLSIYAMHSYSSFNSENPLEVKSLLSKVGKSLNETEEIKKIQIDVEENERLMKGVKAPDFVQADTSGVAIALSSLQGKFVLIDFWASWCKPCRAQNPGLVRLYKKYNAKGFTILSVSLDAKKEAWLNAIRADKLEWQNVSDLQSWGNAVAKQYRISSVPQGYLLNRQGVIIAKNLSEYELDELLEKELSH